MDIPDAAFSPLDLNRFTTFFLVPYIAHKLIMADMECDEAKAYTIMTESAGVGEGLHPEDDEDGELQEILDSNSEAVVNAFRAKETAVAKQQGNRKAGAQVRDQSPLLIAAHKENGKGDHGEETRQPPRFAKKIFIVVRRHSSAPIDNFTSPVPCACSRNPILLRKRHQSPLRRHQFPPRRCQFLR
jgi:hypothetical protein